VASPETDPIAEDAALDLEDLRDDEIFEHEERSHAQTSRAKANAAMDRYAAGDDAAFSELYDLLVPKLHGYLLRQTHDATRADDLLQQTMLQLHSQRATFFKGGEVFPWAFAIARRLLINSYRRRKREVSGKQKASSMVAVAAQGPASTDEVLHSKRMIRTIETELSRLPEAQRVAIELIKKEGLSLREVAEVLGTTSSAIKSRVHRAYEALRAALGDQLDEEKHRRTT
jgi:RNA polymerase sigma-70 factor (ECF subfamily)